MSALQMQSSAPTGAKHSHYVSLHNNTIHPAMTYPPGFQDANPKDWRPATHAEIQRYLAGKDALEIMPLSFGSAAEASPATPKTLRLADDDDIAPAVPAAPAVAEAPLYDPVPAPAPAGPSAPAPVSEAPLPPPPPAV